MKRALIVDDHAANRYLLRVMLEGHGWQIEEAGQGAEALALARAAAPDLVISDLLMPVMDGYTLLRQWKADNLLKHVPFIVFTATYTDPRDERLALELGADAFIIKPMEPELFMARVAEVVDRTNRNSLAPCAAPAIHEEVLLRTYNEVLVHKLEDKATELEALNRRLQADIALRTAAEAKALELLGEADRSRRALLSVVEDQQRAEVDLKANRERLRALAGRLQAVREEERTSIAREIHDVLAQELTRLKIDINWLHKHLAAPLEADGIAVVRTRLIEMNTLADTAIGVVQNIASELRPIVLDSLGLAAAIEWQAARFEERSGVGCSVTVPKDELHLSRAAETGLFRIVQECLTNVSRHACAKEVRITFDTDAQGLVLAITDDGVGFDPSRIRDLDAIGLIGMRERVELLGGYLEISSAPGAGTSIRLTIPRASA